MTLEQKIRRARNAIYLVNTVAVSEDIDKYLKSLQKIVFIARELENSKTLVTEASISNRLINVISQELEGA